MTSPSFASLPPAIADALARQGFTALTKVQEAVLDPALAGCDLRISSQTGSGKTVAVGFVLLPDLERAAAKRAAEVASAPAAKARPCARPDALLIAPTRELAIQLARELTWLFAPLGAKVCSVTGGTSYGNELRSLRDGPRVIVGTPGRLLDHLDRGSIDASQVEAVVLDEADQMLDLGFRDELDGILAKLPEVRRTHLVSATFSREVRALTDRYQPDGVEVLGTRIGAANQDIAHVAHLVRSDERTAALVNLLLLAPGERTLVFVRTRADTAELSERLISKGFRARALSGELEQSERTRTLDAFRSGAITTLVATDVAARGLDVPDVGRVIHAEPPSDPEVYTHRSGRTGRAGRKGTSIVLVSPSARENMLRIFRRAGVEAAFLPAPGPADVLRAADERLSADLKPKPDASPAEAQDPRLLTLAERLLTEMDPKDLVAALLARAQLTGTCAPMPVTPIALPTRAAPMAKPAFRPSPAPRFASTQVYTRNLGGFAPPQAQPRSLGGFAPPQAQPRSVDGLPLSFVPFRINWGERHGADARRLLALVCRRGGIKGSEVGAIRIGFASSTFEVASPAASQFAQSVKEPDARDPRIRIDPMEGVSAGGPAPRARSGPRTPYTHPRRPEAPPA